VKLLGGQRQATLPACLSEFSGMYPILYAYHDKPGRVDNGPMRLQEP